MSFLFAPSQHKAALEAACGNQGWTQKLIPVGSGLLAVANESVSPSLCEQGSKSYAFLGTIANLSEIRQIAASFDSAALTASPAKLAAILLDHLGHSALTFLDGAFILFIQGEADQSLTAISDVLGQYPLYATSGPAPWLAPNPRLLALKPDFEPDFFSEAELLRNEVRADDFVPIKNVIRAKPGTALHLVADGQEQTVAGSVPFHIVRQRGDQLVSLDDAVKGIEAALIPAIHNAFDFDGRAFIPLSGGIDSSIVAAVGASGRSIDSVAFGTERSNEYVPSKLVADHIGSNHSEIEFNTQEILSGLFEAVYYNGIFDGYAAEVQAAIFALMTKMQGKGDLLVTGYGADLILGGTLNPQALPEIGVNAQLWSEVYRTRWSGEFSPVGANMKGFHIRHPFWTPRFVAYCIDLAQELKVSDSEVKIALREFAHRQEILPQQTVWRKKLALHHGSAIEQILTDILGSEVTPQAKEQYAYSLYRDAVRGILTPETFNPDQSLAAFQKAA